MKYILLRGATRSGKSTTMKAICEMIHPERIQQLLPQKRLLVDCNLNEDLRNGTFVLEKAGMIILIAAGSPTEQAIRITVLVDIVIELKGRIDIAIVSMRSYEQMQNFNTPVELQSLGEYLLMEEIKRLPEGFEASGEWNRRLRKITRALENAGLNIGEMA